MKFNTGDDDNQYEYDETEEEGISKEVKKNSISGKKAVKRFLAVLLAALIVLAVFTMITTPRIGECKRLVNDLQTACNNLDLLGIADCMNPTIRNAIYIAVPAGAALSNTSTDEILQEAVNMVGEGILGLTEDSGMQLSELFQRVKIKPLRYGFPGKQRSVVCRLSLGGITQDIRIYIMKKYGEVYINSIKLINY